MYDLNDAQPQMPPVGELIPDGTFARVAMTIRPGGLNGATPADAGVLKASNSSDAKLLDCEFTVVEGPYARRKFWQNFTVAGGKVDEKGQSKGWNIAKSAFRAMIDSALGLEPQGRERRREAETGHRGAEAARRHRVRGPHHDRAGVEPELQGRQQARQRRDARRAAIRRNHARRDRAARAGERQAPKDRGDRDGAGLGDAGDRRAAKPARRPGPPVRPAPAASPAPAPAAPAAAPAASPAGTPAWLKG